MKAMGRDSRRAWRAGRVAVAVLVLGCGTSSLVAEESNPVASAFDHVPADAAAALIVPDCARADGKLKLINEMLGFNKPALNDVLAELKQRIGIRTGFNDVGAAMFLLQDPALPGGIQNGLTLLPVEDFDRFIGNFERRPVKGITRLQMADGRRPFAKSVPGYAVIGSDESRLHAYETTKGSAHWHEAMGAAGQRCLEGADVLLLVNVERFRPVLTPLLRSAMAHVLPGDAGAESARRASLRAMAKLSQAGGLAFLRDARTVILSISAEPDALSLTVSCQFRDASPLAELFKGGGPAAPELLALLPEDRFFMAVAMNLEAFSFGRIMESAEEHLDESSGVRAAMWRHQSDLATRMRGEAVVMYGDGGSAAAGTLSLRLAVALDVADGDAYKRAFRDVLGSLDGTRLDAGLAAGSLVTTAYRVNEQRVGKVNCDRYEVRVESTDPAADPSQAAEGPWSIRGPADTAGYVATVSGRRVVQTNSTDAELISGLVVAAESQRGLGVEDDIESLRKSWLGPEADMEIYMNVAEGMRLLGPLLGIGQHSVPADLPMPAVWAQVRKGGVVMRVRVPMAVLQWARQTFGPEQGGRRFDRRRWR
jgi:hypothetical protein